MSELYEKYLEMYNKLRKEFEEEYEKKEREFEEEYEKKKRELLAKYENETERFREDIANEQQLQKYLIEIVIKFMKWCEIVEKKIKKWGAELKVPNTNLEIPAWKKFNPKLGYYHKHNLGNDGEVKLGFSAIFNKEHLDNLDDKISELSLPMVPSMAEVEGVPMAVPIGRGKTKKKKKKKKKKKGKKKKSTRRRGKKGGRR